MPRTGSRANFDCQSWFDHRVAERTITALAARDASFAEKHTETPLPELARYLARRAKALHHTPSPCEIDGGDFIAQRFGSWDAALRLAKLPSLQAEAKLKNTARYRKEKTVQESLFYEESEQRKKEKRIRAAERHAVEQTQLKEKKQLAKGKRAGTSSRRGGRCCPPTPPSKP